ncbi:MAG: peptidoglycan editing factor PgeF [Gammaproteobacteria bacterium]|nr:MAG: peptidoglycan editing factor PgeF [Gammaproteobacteria bacterium]
MSAGWLWADWPLAGRVQAGVSTREGGVSAPPWGALNLALHVSDRPEHVRENRRRLAATLGLPAEPAWLRQVHGTAVTRLGRPPAAGRVAVSAGVVSAGAPVEADAAVAFQPGVVCAVLTADCLSVVLADTAGQCVGVAHAGWRGLAGGVLEATIAALDVAPARLVAWLGPAISQACFEVGEEVRAAFLAQDEGAGAAFTSNARGRWQADLCELARRRLAAAGVGSVHGGGLCTFSDPARFHSHRRDGAGSGRMATLAWLPGAAPGP